MSSLLHAAHHIEHLPILVLMPHSQCNCRCLMCDIWKADRTGHELSRTALAAHVDDYRRLGVRWVALSGGEAMLHRNLWNLCALFRELPAKISLLSSGLLLTRFAREVVNWCDEVIVSLDGSRSIHDTIRNVPHAFNKLSRGIASLKALRSDFRVTARCVVQRANYFDLLNVVRTAKELGLDQVSFVAADVSTPAFNRPLPWNGQRIAEIALDPTQVEDFRRVVEALIADCQREFHSRFIAESPDKLRLLPQYFAALNGHAAFPKTVCNAPWVSTVIEADGTVRPCFFHSPLGNIHQQSLNSILNGETAIAFRQQLDVQTNAICRKCVCSLYLRDQDVA